jgi:hypothetical protein
MNRILVHPTDTAHWLALVTEAQASSQIELHEEIESYLVFMLMRFMAKPEMATNILGLEFLEGANCLGQQRHEQLRDVGDQCLLVSGLFPGRAETKQVRLSYFIKLGQSAYSIISSSETNHSNDLFGELSDRFVHMRDVLNAIRALTANKGAMSFWQAFDLWDDTQSPLAKQVLDDMAPNLIHNPSNKKQ